MKWQLLAIGKPKLPFAAAGIAEYLKRLRAFTRVEVDFLKSSEQEKESSALLRRSEHTFRIVLDERGEELTSRELAARITCLEHSAAPVAALLVGGADGHTAEVRRSADLLWSLSKLTLQHELALLVAMEQLYRAYTIKAGLPYHRD